MLAALSYAATYAQSNGSTDVDVNLKGDGGGSSYWLWIIGAIIFILLLVALLRGRGSSNRVVEKKTVVKD